MRASKPLCNLAYRPSNGNATRYLFALFKLQCCWSSSAWRGSNASIDCQHPINAALVPPLKRSGDVRHTLTALPSLPKLCPLFRREPRPCIPLHRSPPNQARLEVLRRSVEPTGQSGHSLSDDVRSAFDPKQSL